MRLTYESFVPHMSHLSHIWVVSNISVVCVSQSTRDVMCLACSCCVCHVWCSVVSSDQRVMSCIQYVVLPVLCRTCIVWFLGKLQSLIPELEFSKPMRMGFNICSYLIMSCQNPWCATVIIRISSVFCLNWKIEINSRKKCKLGHWSCMCVVLGSMYGAEWCFVLCMISGDKCLI